MKFLPILLALIPLVLTTDDETLQWLKLLNLPQPVVTGQKATPCRLNSQTVTDFVANNPPNKPLVLVVKSCAQSKSNCADTLVESSDQLLASRNITVCQLSLGLGQASTYGTDGTVVVLLNGKQHQYYGRRSPSALLSYVLKLNTSHVRLITGKLDKIAYDLVAGPKLIGFFMPATPEGVATADLQAYESVALKYSPNIPFYLVVDRNVAKHLKLSLVGQINLVKPFEKVAVTCPVNPATAQDIEAFIEANKGVLLKYVTEHNIFDPQLQNPNKTTLIAIGDRSSAVGQYFHKLLTRTIRNITRENNITQTLLSSQTQTVVTETTEQVVTETTTTTAGETTTPAPEVASTPLPTIVDLNAIEILWIDPQVFPSIGAYLDQIPVQSSEVYLGAVTANQSNWLDTSLFNKTADKTADEANLQLLKDWISGVIANQTSTIEVIITSESSFQSFIKEPQSQNVAEGSELVLECLVKAQVGDCLWLKDGQNIGFNLARISTDYKWRDNRGLGDCTLVIASAQADRDAGEWVCEVTGDASNPTVTSNVAVITVRAKTEL